jgi:hypothetical protein
VREVVLNAEIRCPRPVLYTWTFAENERWLPRELAGVDRLNVSRRLYWFLLGKWRGAVVGANDDAKFEQTHAPLLEYNKLTQPHLSHIVTPAACESLRAAVPSAATMTMTALANRSSSLSSSSSSIGASSGIAANRMSDVSKYAVHCLNFLHDRMRWQDGSVCVRDVEADVSIDLFSLLDNAINGVESIVVKLFKAVRVQCSSAEVKVCFFDRFSFELAERGAIVICSVRINCLSMQLQIATYTCCRRHRRRRRVRRCVLISWQRCCRSAASTSRSKHSQRYG